MRTKEKGSRSRGSPLIMMTRSCRHGDDDLQVSTPEFIPVKTMAGVLSFRQTTTRKWKSLYFPGVWIPLVQGTHWAGTQPQNQSGSEIFR